MSRSSEAANSVVSACEEACERYRVPVFRVQSRVFTVTGTNGKSRPMFVGRWKDALGIPHTSGMADLLAMPRIRINAHFAATVPLWIEAKSGRGELSQEQQAFKCYVESCGAYYLEARDCADTVLEFFRLHGIA